ncbi:hypothetical protein GYMLUDRAFT_65449 [Collybiopsis luxurians FD-317 M1]|uniref:Uncharacterized protein n=1 Tax=Collybiopsis luxurians FD-317 M1 TaxID=944289 RepID=A0A0D0AIS8_9AGAR|nr:hypothetical protein GYMLUDRAFT_65449 [Collybiopsis luxurians FD-317 M1]
MVFPATATGNRVSIEQEIARLEYQIDEQTRKLGTVRRNNIKQIQRSITTRQEKVDMLKKQLAQSAGEPIPTREQQIIQTTNTELFNRPGWSSDLSDVDGGEENNCNDFDLVPLNAFAQRNELEFNGSLSKMEAFVKGIPQPDSKRQEILTVSEDSDPQLIMQHKQTESDHLVNNRDTLDANGYSSPMLAISSKAPPISFKNPTRDSIGQLESIEPNPKGTSPLMGIDERVGDILDQAMGRNNTSLSSSGPVKTKPFISGAGLSEGAQSLMIGWKYLRNWSTNGSTNLNPGATSSDTPGMHPNAASILDSPSDSIVGDPSYPSLTGTRPSALSTYDIRTANDPMNISALSDSISVQEVLTPAVSQAENLLSDETNNVLSPPKHLTQPEDILFINPSPVTNPSLAPPQPTNLAFGNLPSPQEPPALASPELTNLQSSQDNNHEKDETTSTSNLSFDLHALNCDYRHNKIVEIPPESSSKICELTSSPKPPNKPLSTSPLTLPLPTEESPLRTILSGGPSTVRSWSEFLPPPPESLTPLFESNSHAWD